MVKKFKHYLFEVTGGFYIDAALTALWEIDQYCRSLLKHGDPTNEERRLAEEVRKMIPNELLEI